jgi:hypothetical protein
MSGASPASSPDEAPKVYEEKPLASWAEFRKTIADLEGGFAHFDTRIGSSQRNQIVYRGQRCAKWALTTTLERETSRHFTVLTYLDCATRYHSEIESITGRAWALPSEDETAEVLDAALPGVHVNSPAYAYLVYLRHHGFPSPLLDWSRSPYVAAYFAFESANPSSNDRVAIYAYIDSRFGTRVGFASAATVSLLAPNVVTDRRHFMQQALYTWCLRRNDAIGDFDIFSHHQVLANVSDRQDILVRITLPASEKRAALRDLQSHNINHYTLFGTEDALAKTLATRAFLLD